MSKQTYEITAWCDRRFFALMSVEADSPETALEIGKRQVHDAPAEDCNGGWDWDQFRVEDEKGDAVLEHLEEHVHLTLAARQMLAVLRAIVESAYHDDDDEDDDPALVPVEYIKMARGVVAIAEGRAA